MEDKTKFKIRTFLYYLVVEPWTEKISLPNFGSLVWLLILVSVILKIEILMWISVGIGVISYGIKEYKSGKYIYWYKMQQYKKFKKEKKNSPKQEAEEISSSEENQVPEIENKNQ